MTHRTHSNTAQEEPEFDFDTQGPVSEALGLLAEQGFDGLARALEILLNEAMKIERTQVLETRPYERTPPRRGQANGFKPKTLKSRIGALELAVIAINGIPVTILIPAAATRKGRPFERPILGRMIAGQLLVVGTARGTRHTLRLVPNHSLCRLRFSTCSNVGKPPLMTAAS